MRAFLCSLTILSLVAMTSIESLAQTNTKGNPPTRSSPTARPILVEQAKSSAWSVTITLNKMPAEYAPGDFVVATVTSAEDGYLYLFNVVGQETNCIFPNNYQSNNKVTANQAVTVPDPNDRNFTLKVSLPAGTESLLAIVTKEPLKELKVPELTRAVKLPGPKPGTFTRGWVPPRLTSIKLRRVIVEAAGGDPNSVSPNDPGIQTGEQPANDQPAPQGNSQLNPNEQQTVQNTKKMASASVEFTIVEENKGLKPKPKK